jgi:hypothetical protein
VRRRSRAPYAAAGSGDDRHPVAKGAREVHKVSLPDVGTVMYEPQNSLSTMRSMWKWIGLAGVAGVVAGGVLVARDQRKRRAYTPDEVRARLHQRLAESERESSPSQ